MNEFPPMPYGSKRKRKEDLSFGKPFEPSYVYSLVSLLNSTHIEGCLEDAEDVLNFLLCGLHEELGAVINAFRNTAKENSNVCEAILTNGHVTEDQEHDPNTKSNVIKSSHSFHSPISDIFGGQITSTMTVGNETSTSSHHFFTLTVDIQAEDVCQVNDALAYITPKELAHDFTPTDSKGGVEAFHKVVLKVLPLVLVLHIKRFVKEKGAKPRKVFNDIEFSIDLEIPEEFLSQDIRRKYSPRALRSYKLFAVVCHEGKDLATGHYITDVYHVGSSSWLRCDDSTITVITESNLLSHCPQRVPYLLFYRRLDTLYPSK
ncbi:ubiquitin carboxyl-terminal hydrolase 10-A-like [Limulus polyphemus]|uniref:ubiquitinyl hydrolase 1 n=1 Tax=Limulus polyphemus TaxID=6850 RepID=A0ABM1BU87_LIMPO|nr:ubiquitin carboxyl-terminal hydrolase 10-A-like [Limulus polyphemus]